MSFRRRVRLTGAVVCVCAAGLVYPQTPPPPAEQPKPAPAPQKKQSQNPFETVPQAPTQQPLPQQRPAQPPPAAPGAKPQFEAPKAPETPKQAEGQVVEAIEFRGSRRVPQDTLRAIIVTKKRRQLQ